MEGVCLLESSPGIERRKRGIFKRVAIQMLI